MAKQAPPTRQVRLSRRAFLRALQALSTSVLLPACAGPPTSSGAATQVPSTAVAMQPSPGGASKPAAASSPARGGTYRILTPADVPSLDAAFAIDYIDWWASYSLLYNRLYSFDERTVIYPDLAAAFPEVSADRLRYTISLRKDVRFHDGRSLTAEDVKFSLERALYPDAPSFAASFLAIVAGADEVRAGRTRDLRGVRVLDPATVEISLTAPQSVFPSVLGVATYGITAKQAFLEAGPAWGVEAVVGTGPFKLAAWERGRRLVFERNPDYFRPGLPYLDRVELYLNVDEAAGVLRWENQEAEFVYAVAPSEKAALLARGDARVRSGPMLTFDYLQISRVEPFTDLRVRQALAHAIDRQELAERLGSSTPIEGIYPASLQQHDPSFRSRYAYDPERARRLLAEAGYGQGIDGLVLWAGLNPSSDLGLLLQDYLRAVGITVELLIIPPEEALPQIEAGQFPLWTGGYGSDYPDASAFVTQRLLCSTPPPPAAWCDPLVASLARQADLLEPDDPARLALLHRIQEQVVNETVELIPLYERKTFGLGQLYVRDDIINPLIGLPILERAWGAWPS